jgi:hypothetical protein
MFNSKAVRSVLALLAMCGMAACSAGSGSSPSGAAPALDNSGAPTAAPAAFQTASVETSLKPVDATVDTASEMSHLSLITSAVVSASADGAGRIIELRDASGASVLVVNSSADYMTSSSGTDGVVVSNVVVDHNDDMTIKSLSARVGNVDAVFTFGAVDKGQDQGQNQGQNQSQTTPKQEMPKQEMPKQEAPKQEAPKQEAPKQEAPKQEAPKQEAPKQEAPKQESPKQETPKQETPKQETPKQETPKQETGKGGKQM